MTDYLKYLEIENKCQKGLYNLLKYKKGEEPNKFHIWKAYRILKNLDKIITEKGKFKLENNEEYLVLLFREIKDNEELKSKARKIKNTKKILENILDETYVSKKRVNSAIKELGQIKEQCIKYETEIIELL